MFVLGEREQIQYLGVGVVVLVWLLTVSSNSRAGAATVVCLKAPWLYEQGLLRFSCWASLSWGSLEPPWLVPQLAEPVCEQPQGTAEEQLGQAAGVSCPGAQPHLQGTSMRSL